jgi:hypothetical protein
LGEYCQMQSWGQSFRAREKTDYPGGNSKQSARVKAWLSAGWREGSGGLLGRGEVVSCQKENLRGRRDSRRKHQKSLGQRVGREHV